VKRQLPPGFDLKKDGDTVLQFNDAPSNRAADDFQHKLDAEIAAAGGIDAWRAIQSKDQKQAA
jgi:hypothetical protein